MKKGRLCNGKGILELNSILGNYGRAEDCLKSGETLGKFDISLFIDLRKIGRDLGGERLEKMKESDRKHFARLGVDLNGCKLGSRRGGFNRSLE